MNFGDLGIALAEGIGSGTLRTIEERNKDERETAKLEGLLARLAIQEGGRNARSDARIENQQALQAARLQGGGGSRSGSRGGAAGGMDLLAPEEQLQIAREAAGRTDAVAARGKAAIDGSLFNGGKSMTTADGYGMSVPYTPEEEQSILAGVAKDAQRFQTFLARGGASYKDMAAGDTDQANLDLAGSYARGKVPEDMANTTSGLLNGKPFDPRSNALKKDETGAAKLGSLSNVIRDYTSQEKMHEDAIASARKLIADVTTGPAERTELKADIARRLKLIENLQSERSGLVTRYQGNATMAPGKVAPAASGYRSPLDPRR